MQGTESEKMKNLDFCALHIYVEVIARGSLCECREAVDLIAAIPAPMSCGIPNTPFTWDGLSARPGRSAMIAARPIGQDRRRPTLLRTQKDFSIDDFC